MSINEDKTKYDRLLDEENIPTALQRDESIIQSGADPIKIDDGNSTDSGLKTDSDIDDTSDHETREFLKADFINSQPDINKVEEERLVDLGEKSGGIVRKKTQMLHVFADLDDDEPEAQQAGCYERTFSRRDRKCHSKIYMGLHFVNIAVFLFSCYLVGGQFDLLDAKALNDAEENIKIYALVQVLIYMFQVTFSSVVLGWYEKSKLEATDVDFVENNRVFIKTFLLWIVVTVGNAGYAIWGLGVINGASFNDFINKQPKAVVHSSSTTDQCIDFEGNSYECNSASQDSAVTQADYRLLQYFLQWLAGVCISPLVLPVILTITFFFISRYNKDQERKAADRALIGSVATDRDTLKKQKTIMQAF